MASWISNPCSPNPFVITQRNVKEQWDFFSGLMAAIESYPLKPCKIFLSWYPAPPSPLTSPRHPDLDPNPLPLILTSMVPLTNARHWYWSAACRWEVMDVHVAAKKPACITLMLSNQASRRVLSSTHEGAPCLKRLLKPNSSDCGEPHP